MTLQWVVLGTTAFLALQRLPSAIRGENRGMFWAMATITLAVALSIPFFYLQVDSLLGGRNIANLLLRFSVFATFLILGVKVTSAFTAPRAQRLISGPVGFIVLGMVVAAVTVLFALSDVPESSTALRAYADQGTVAAYGDTARLYQMYVAACLAPALFLCAVDSRRRRDIRISAGLMSLGMSSVVLHALLSLAAWNLPRGAWDRILPYSAVLVISIALAMMWNARRTEKKRPKSNLLAEAYGTR
ncbi:hypothetical protein [Arthrobacter sunyaminii]|uniref:Uncharacterized protein n=1 Tax=Arthrobacter sunyaminii TaxID=2816859 RepID=A0A975S5W3_9MICC|nr:hypothetical protein [Arthrobacter sunyaminii]MBO0896794.1 hypothetical protein [Arthrobacter sunyaminii]MBO0909277.1 hypothetical protein [Arthrobacter sunyaminii]QWQ36391.1 hypothetical protein KG104_00640 [Arthrobacter sunyaminii]